MDSARRKYSRCIAVKSACMLRRFLVACSLLALFSMAGAPAAAQLTLDSVFGLAPPWGSQPSRITWAPDGNSFLYVLQSQDPFRAVPVHQYDALNNQDRILIDPRAFGSPPATPGSLTWSPDSR